VADEYLVLDRHTLADKSMAGDLAPFADACILLNLDERADLALIANLTAIQIDEFREFHAFAHLHVGCNADVLIHK
jgi:hypothetical protein